MEKIAHNLILEEQHYQRDFVSEEKYYAHAIESRTPFYWLISETDCQLIYKDDEKEVHELVQQLDISFQFCDSTELYLYEFDGQNLLPISRKRFLKQKNSESNNQ